MGDNRNDNTVGSLMVRGERNPAVIPQPTLKPTETSITGDWNKENPNYYEALKTLPIREAMDEITKVMDNAYEFNWDTQKVGDQTLIHVWDDFQPSGRGEATTVKIDSNDRARVEDSINALEMMGGY